MTMDQYATPALQGILDEATRIRKVDKDVFIFRVLHGYNQVVRTFQRKVRAHGYEVSNAKLSAEVDGLRGGKTAWKGVCVSMKMTRTFAHKMTLVGEHALSNVDLTINDGVNVASGCIRHVRGMVWVCRDGGATELKGGRFNENVWEKRGGEGELNAIRAQKPCPAIHFPFRPLGLIYPPITLIRNPLATHSASTTVHREIPHHVA
jgi:hypothetical protein